MKRLILSLLAALSLAVSAQVAPQPKREFRGAWIQMINGQFQGMDRTTMQANLTHQLDKLRECGVNAVMFQVRGEADALYESPYEPWSRFLTGQQGKAPSPRWDPLEWMVREAHKRGMELHAWINPYRAKTKGTKELAATHPYKTHPERFFAYDGLLLFNPGLQENRDYICMIAGDIVNRYDVDGLHIDDYFYPYPAAGQEIPDEETFRAHGNGMTDRADWRRYNVNLLIQQLSETVHTIKPWVKFGVSPFGIYHNADGSMVPGSKTRGLQNYDDLYADVLYWVEQGWVDYNIPQIYWEIGHKVADYDTLARWWSRYAAKRPLYIGQDVERTVKAVDVKNPKVNQLPAKFDLQRSLPGVEGSCLWYSAAVVANTGNFATALARRYHKYPALQPAMPFLTSQTPGKVRGLKAVTMPDGRRVLCWQAGKSKRDNWETDATAYVVYRFARGERADLSNPAAIVAVTREPFYALPAPDGRKHTYVVTALNRIQNEGKAAKKSVK